MTAAMVPAVADLESLCFSLPWSEKSIAEELQNPWAIWLVARYAGQFAGYLGVQYGPDGADIMNIATEPAFRRKGISTVLMKDMLFRLKEKQLAWLTLEVRASNTPAIALYESFGFEKVGLRKNYYTKPREDAILMTKYLTEQEADIC